MIQSRTDYLDYIHEDRAAMRKESRHFPLTLFDWPLRYQLVLRRAEYFVNCKKQHWQRPLVLWVRWRHRKMGYKCGFSIPLNVFGKGLNIAHIGTIVVNAGAVVGDYCRIHACVNIGTKAGYDNLAPRIGNRVYIGPGAALFGDIEIADDIAIGANSVVNKSFTEPGISIAGIPAKKISDNGSKGLLYTPFSHLLHPGTSIEERV